MGNLCCSCISLKTEDIQAESASEVVLKKRPSTYQFNGWNSSKYAKNSETKNVEVIDAVYNEDVKYAKVKSISHLSFRNDVNICRGIYDEEDERVLMCDYLNGHILVFDVNANSILKYNPDNLLKNPFSIIMNLKRHFIVSDFTTRQTYLFNSSFEKSSVLYNSNQDLVGDMAFDDINKNLYICDNLNHKLGQINLKEPSAIDYLRFGEIQPSRPTYLKQYRDRLYIIDYSTFLRSEDNKLEQIIDGKNSIFIIDKIQGQVVDAIKLGNWLQPSGLYIDEDMNIITTAYEINELTNKISDSRYLYMFDAKGELIQKTYLHINYNISDFIVIDQNEILFLTNNDGIFVTEFS